MQIHWHWILTFFLTVVQITGWLLIPKALFIARTPQAALGWGIALFFLPLISIPLFLVFGESSFSGYTRAGNGANDRLDKILANARAAMTPVRGTFSEKYADVALLIERLRGLPVTGRNSARLLVDGEQTFDAIFRAIERAQQSIMVQFFIIRDDSLGNKLKDALIAAAKRGVKIHVLFDSIGSKDISLSYLDALRNAGIYVHGFVTNRQLGMRFQINFRNHRKLVLVDNDTAFIGGLNAADEYLTGGAKFDSWRDTHLEIRGPAISTMRVNFAEDWWYSADELPQVECSAPMSCDSGNMRLAAFATGPADKCNLCEAVYGTAIFAARERVWLASPYFVPDFALRQSLMQAALRGVDVRILLPSRPDHLLPWWSSFSYYPAMRDAGVKIYRYLPGFMHQKVLLVDDDFAIVGSVNADYRSFMLNFELSAAINDGDFAAETARMLERDFAGSRLENMNLYEESNLWFRLRVKLAHLSSMEQ
ncbi:MAG: cardiolipin synthase [Verrucomicrobiales bacterium]|nr:cardiolipin synthase [Verrucomicrobiales bacterium]